ncbi:MAG: SMP-30/gluconolactonase/LRE family protein [Bryobacterales bacterium]|nr:SMP-30/gluconolactonase/LRE family protein [Bryobacterales bacterium]
MRISTFSLLLPAIAGLLLTPCAPAQAPDTFEVAASTAFTEGPAIYKDGSVFFTEMAGHRIMRLFPDGSLSVFRSESNNTNGLLFDHQWRLVMCEMSDEQLNRPRVTRMNIETGETEVLAERFEGKTINAPNDVTIDRQGRLYFTDFDRSGADRVGTPGVYRIDPDNSLHRLLGPPDVQRPNGIVLSPDEQTLYLVESHPGEQGNRHIRAYDLSAQGTLANGRILHNFFPGRSADGLCMDPRTGDLFAVAGLNRRRGSPETLDTKAGLYRFSAEGKLLHFYPIWEDTVTNCTISSNEPRIVYVTAGKLLLKLPLR